MKDIIRPAEGRLLAKKLVDYSFRSSDYFWEEDACCPNMNPAQLEIAARKATRIHTTLNFVSKRLGVTESDVAKVTNRMDSPREYVEQIESIVLNTHVQRRVASKLVEHNIERKKEFNSSISPYWGEQAKRYGVTLVRDEFNKPIAFRQKDGNLIKIDVENNTVG